MATFQFSTRRVELEFPGGVKYELPLTEEIQQKVRAAAKKLLDETNALKGAQGGEEDFDTLCDITMDAIDEILGEGSADQIMEAKEDYSFLDCADVFKFITDEIGAEFRKITASYNTAPRQIAVVSHGGGNRRSRRRRK